MNNKIFKILNISLQKSFKILPVICLFRHNKNMRLLFICFYAIFLAMQVPY